MNRQKPITNRLFVERVEGVSGQIHIAYTHVASGSFDLASPRLLSRRQAITGFEAVSWLRQEHGTTIEIVDGAHPNALAGPSADGAITNQTNHAICVITADCAPVALWTEGGVVGAVHAGWKGLYAGILEKSIEAMRAISGESEVFAWLGPCIGAECYEFGGQDLSLMVSRFGHSVRSVTSNGSPALDMTAGIQRALGDAGATWRGSAGICTACDDQFFSWRARKSSGRQALFVWCESGAN
jgi:polyphenol oxidase